MPGQLGERAPQSAAEAAGSSPAPGTTSDVRAMTLAAEYLLAGVVALAWLHALLRRPWTP